MSINKLANDYGHGVGQDRGAVGVVPEENVINNIASHTDVLFQNKGVELIWTRPTSSSSVNDSLNQRCSKANSNGVDLFISHHANMGRGDGHEIWVIGLGGQAEQYARKVDRALTALGSNSRGIKVGNLAVLRGTNAPAILIEYFFLDNQYNVDFYNQIGAYTYAKAVVEAITGSTIGEEDNPITIIKESQKTIEKEERNVYMSKKYKNGSTRENVYSDYSLTNKIGSLDPWESCEAIQDLSSRMIVLYNTSNGKKTGFVGYRGGL